VILHHGDGVTEKILATATEQTTAATQTDEPDSSSGHPGAPPR
jgi:hypothetical protein